MPIRRTRAPLDFAPVRAGLDAPNEFPAEVRAAAEAAAATPRLPDHDLTDLAFVTIDPPGSLDLDQALRVESRDGGGWVVRYAIADVAAFVTAGDPVDVEARRRGQTLYSPDRTTPLYPRVLGEGAASLLADQDRPAVVWTIDVDGDGRRVGTDVRRAMVRSRAQLTYADVQAAIDAGTPPEPVAELPALGEALLARARDRDAIDLGIPEQEVVRDAAGRWTLEMRRPQSVERWNAQVSLLTGMAAATLMLHAGVGLLRTLPRARRSAVQRLRPAARVLGIDWPPGHSIGDLVAGLDASEPRQAAFIDLAADLLRGAGYVPLGVDAAAAPRGRADTRGARTGPPEPFHAGVGAAYAHVTAPIRRLCDRFGTEVCVAVVARQEVPAWVTDALGDLPAAMAASDRRAKALERATVDLTEAYLLEDRVGEEFVAAVVEARARRGTVVLDDPAVRAPCDGPNLPLGERITVRCVEADVSKGSVRFEPAAASTGAVPAAP